MLLEQRFFHSISPRPSRPVYYLLTSAVHAQLTTQVMPSRRSASPSRGAPRGRSRSRSRTPMSRSASPLPRRRRSPSRSRSRSRSYSRSRSRCYSPDGRGSRGGGGGGGGGNFRAVKLHGLTKAVHERHLKYIFGAYGDIEEVEVYRFAQCEYICFIPLCSLLAYMQHAVAYMQRTDASSAQRASPEATPCSCTPTQQAQAWPCRTCTRDRSTAAS